MVGLQPLKPGETAQPMNYTYMIQNPDALLHKMREAEAIYKRLSSRINNPPPRIIVRARTPECSYECSYERSLNVP